LGSVNRAFMSSAARQPVVRRAVASCVATALLGGAASCKREQRSFRVPPPAAQLSEAVPSNDPLRPGPVMQATDSTTVAVSMSRLTSEPYGNQFLNNAQAQSDGQTLYEAMNCSGCHAHGGGGMGPPLLDNKWFYGSAPAEVYTSIMEGRPNGMPSFRGRIPDFQVWEIAAYVLSLSGQANPNAASGREDHMAAQPPPNSKPKETPTTVPEPATLPARGTSTGEVSPPPTTTAPPTTSPPSTRSAAGTEPATAPTGGAGAESK